MKKFLLPLLLTIISITEAQMIDAIAIDVEGEPITTLEIQAVQQKMNMSKEAAVEALIKDRLEMSALNKANIEISPSEVQGKVQAIARSKGMSQEQMKRVLLEKGLTWNSYIEQLTNTMRKERFYRQYIASTITPPSDADLEMYYNANRSKFANAPIQMSLVLYASSSREALQEAIANPMKPIQGVKKKNILASSNEMSPELFNLIKSTPSGEQTKIINTGRGFVSYYVKSKGSQGQGGFEGVKKAVTMRWLQEHRVQAGQDFFNKLKSNANIRVIRL